MAQDEQGAKLIVKRDLGIFAEHYQVHMFDSALVPEVSIYWDDNSREGMLFVTDEFIGIGTARHLEVPVTVEVYSEEPQGEDYEEWDHVTECSIEVPSGKLLFTGPSEDFQPAEEVELLGPGTYGVRVFYGSLAEIDEEGFEGEDSYRVVLWKSEHHLAPAVVKRWGGTVTYFYQ